jgi:MarR family transcriptional regulator for hemolysin
MSLLDDEDYFDQWNTLYGRFYPPGTRLDAEFRTSRMLVFAGRSWTHRIEAKLLKETGQTRARWQVLFAIAFAEQPVTMGELCRRVRVQWPTMVRVVESMERDNLLRREDHPDDKRSRYIFLTQEGEQVMQRIQPVLDQERAKVLSLLTDEELNTVQSLLERIFRGAIS